MTIPEYYNIDKDIESQNKSELNGTIKCLEELLKKAKSLSEKMDKIPDNVEDIPPTPPIHELKQSHWEDYDKMISERYQFIAHCYHFKCLYDKDFTPDWDSTENDRWFIVFMHGPRNEFKPVSTERIFDKLHCCIPFENKETIYFSSKVVASKCAEWLNYVYKTGKYAESKNESNQSEENSND